MKADVILDIALSRDDLDRLGGTLESILPEGRVHAGAYEMRFRKGDSQLAELLATLDALSVPYHVREERSFRPREIVEAVALRLAPESRNLEATLDSESAQPFSGGCTGCGAGAEQTGDLVLESRPAESTALAWTDRGQILVSESIARVMIAEGVSGCLLRATRDTDGRTLPCFQVQPIATLPPLCVPPTRIANNPLASCPQCGNGGLHVDSLFYYDLEESLLHDVNVCREPLGHRPGSGVVISQKLFRLFYEVGAIPAIVEPIVLV